MKRFLLLFCLILLFIGRSLCKEKFIFPVLNYRGQLVSNFYGGDKSTVQWMGLLTGGLQLNTEKANWWHGGLFDIEAISTHGKGITASTLHDALGISKIEAGNHLLLAWKVFYEQQINNFRLRLGLQDINDSFMNQSCVSDFSGSSYGVFPTASMNFSITNYPVSGLGLALSYKFLNKFTAVTSLFNGRVSNVDDDIFNVQWPLNTNEDGLLSISEIKYESGSDTKYETNFAIGAIFHSHYFDAIKDENIKLKDNCAFYLYGDRCIYNLNDKKITTFLQGSYALRDRNEGYGYSAIGGIFDGFLTHSHIDHIGIGLTQLYFQEKNDKGLVCQYTESDLETYVKFQINKFLSIQPTFIFVHSTKISNAMVGLIEFYLNVF